MNRIKPEDVTVEELKDGLRDISNYALISILKERVKLNEVGLHELRELLESSPEFVCAKIWQKDDIRRYKNGDKLTEDQVDFAARLSGDALQDCTDYDWMAIEVAIDQALGK